MLILKDSGFIKNMQNSSDGKIQSNKYKPLKCLGFNCTENDKKMFVLV
jgi:hypothetical protein